MRDGIKYFCMVCIWAKDMVRASSGVKSHFRDMGLQAVAASPLLPVGAELERK